MEDMHYPKVGETLYHMRPENGLHIYIDKRPEFQKSYAFLPPITAAWT